MSCILSTIPEILILGLKFWPRNKRRCIQKPNLTGISKNISEQKMQQSLNKINKNNIHLHYETGCQRLNLLFTRILIFFDDGMRCHHKINFCISLKRKHIIYEYLDISSFCVVRSSFVSFQAFSKSSHLCLSDKLIRALYASTINAFCAYLCRLLVKLKNGKSTIYNNLFRNNAFMI